MLDLVPYGITGGQNQNWDLGLRFPDSVQNLAARKTGKHQVQNDEVILISLGKIPAVLPITSHIDCKALGDQAAGHKTGDLLFVLDHQDAHFLNPLP